ncbi:SPW repeat protein [Pseudophaeobacter flagellatus]|uniref:SPW repeat protein n=1 Tax=Pseudophaeobacter flagellatus TaxID=2899119 RepID=UPI001E5D3FD0|nr:SPW repeat protein [Pseudophaeobacter flagellatus]MCD9148772.1 SPW repeat protein [Pseudophaeobacter flagellatus]
MERMHFQDGITLVAGVVLVAVPFALAITPPEGTGLTLLIANFVLSGVAAIILGAAALFYFRKWEEWLDIVLGVWLVASPWIVGFTYSQMAMWIAIACGVVIAAMGIWRTVEENGEHAY